MNRIKGSAIWQTNKNDVQTHKSQRFSGELGFNYEPDEHHSFGLRYMPETGIGLSLIHICSFRLGYL